ncbi:MAG: choice-of-anchor J domain-containing protein [Hyphomicrobiales bacterium]
MLRKFTILASLLIMWSMGFSQSFTLTETFENGIPSDWKVIDNNNDNAKWAHSNRMGHDDLFSVFISYNDNTGHDDYLFTPAIKVTGDQKLSFYAIKTEGTETMDILISKGNQTIEDATITVAKVEITSGDYTKFEYDLSTIEGINKDDIIYIAFKATTPKEQGFIVMDDIEVSANLPYEINQVTAQLEAIIGSSASTGDIYTLTNKGDAPLTISSVTDLSATNFSSTIPTDLSTISLAKDESLNFGFNFNATEVGVKNQEFVITTNVGVITISLEGTCLNDAVAFYKTSFESTDPKDYTIIDNNKDNKKWKASWGFPVEGDKALYITCNSEKKHDDWLVTPLLEVKEGSTFSFYVRSKGRAGEISVFASKTGKEVENFTIPIQEKITIDHGYVRYRYDVSLNDQINAGDKIHLAIQTTSQGIGTDKLYMDVVKFSDPDLPGDEADILEFSADSQIGDFAINGTTITGLVTNETDLSAFTPTYKLSRGATVSPEGVLDLSNNGTATITVTSEDTKTTTEYTVIVTKEPAAVESLDENFNGSQLPETWRVLNPDNDTRWALETNSNHGTEEGNCVTIMPDNFSKDNNDYLISPRLKVTGESTISFWVRRTSKDENLEILVGKEDFSIEALSQNLLKAETITSIDWEQKVYKIKDIEGIVDGDEVYIAIHSTTKDGVKTELDDFQYNIFESEAKILDMTFTGIIDKAKISHENLTITADADSEIDIKSLAPTFAISPGATISPEDPQDFSNGAVPYTVEQGELKSIYQVSINQHINTESDITSFKVEGQLKDERITDVINTVQVVVPEGTDLTKITPTIEISSKATISPASGAEVNFSNGPVTYTVTSESGIEKEWSVIVSDTDAFLGLYEDFEKGAVPEEWIAIDNDGDGATWKVLKNKGLDKSHGAYSQFKKKNTQDNWLITPKIKVRERDEFSFWARSSASSFLEDFNVKVSKSGTELENFTITIAEVKKASANYGFTKYEYLLESTEGINAGDEIHIAIQVVSVDASQLHLDNVRISPRPNTPVLSVDKETHLMIGELNNKTTEQDVFTITNEIGGTLQITDIQGLEDSPFSVDLKKEDVALTKGQTHKFGVTYQASKLGKENGYLTLKSNGGDITIKLEGYGYKEDYYHEGFEIEANIEKWSTIDGDGDGNEFFRIKNYSLAPDLAHTGEHCVASESRGAEDKILHPDNYLISPKVSVKDGDKLTFWIGAVSKMAPNENFSIKISTKENKLQDFEEILLGNQLTKLGYTLYELDLSKYAEKDIFIAFEHHNVSNESQLILDDVILPQLTIGIDEKQNDILFTLAPNPAKEYVEINTPENANMAILNSLGEVVSSKAISKGINKIDINNLPAGIYIIKLQNDNIQSSQKLIIRH